MQAPRPVQAIPESNALGRVHNLAPFLALLMLTLSPDLQTPLVSQIVDGLRGLIAGQVLKPGAKLPSIRAFAAELPSRYAHQRNPENYP